MDPQVQSPPTLPSQNLEAQVDQVAAAQAKEQNDTKTTGSDQEPGKSTVKNAQKNTVRSTQMHLQIAELRDNLAVLKNGGIRAVLKTSSINVHLKSEDEQNAIIYSYQNFLNTLEFPVQIVVRSKKLDLDDYIDKLKGIAEKQTNPLLKDQTVDYVDYIQRLIEYADIMQKDFYVIVPYDPLRAKKVSFIQKFIEHMSPKDSVAQLRQRHQEFESLRKGINQRMNIVKSGLENCGLKVDQLTTEELITLFYECYNPRTSRIQKFKKSDDLDVVRDPDVFTAKQVADEE